MQTLYLIIGQGISGTLLSWFLYKAGKNFIVIDNNAENSASKIAAGIINPVTGRRYVTTWMIEEVMEFAESTYNEIGFYLNKKYSFQKSIIDFFPSPQMRNAFIERLNENDTYLHSYPDQNHFNQYFNYDFGCGEISPAYLVNIQELLWDWRMKLKEKGFLLEEGFNLQELETHSGSVKYKDINAEKIIFCDGITATENPWFKALPFSPNKGEVIIIESEALTNQHLFKKGLMLVPLPKENTFWVGSNYKWEFDDNKPSKEFYEHATAVLNHWLKKPYKILDHKAAVRPATLERRPFVGLHPHNNNIGILNGMGTKGTSLAPFFAHQLADHLIFGTPIDKEAHISRFQRILSK